MSLVPIIYTSLIIFFGFLIFVLLISYISFRARVKNNPVIDEVRRNQLNIYSAPRPIINHQPQAAYNHTKQTGNYAVKKETIYDQERRNHNPQVVSSNYFQQEERVGNRTNSFDRDYREERRNDYRTTNIKIVNGNKLNKTRIEIMNQTERNQQKRTTSEINTQNSNLYSQEVSHLNILNFYEDSADDNDLYAIIAPPYAKSV